MTRTILFLTLWSLTASMGIAQEPASPAGAMPSLPAAPTQAASPQPATETKVFTLTSCTATDVAQLLKHLHPDPAFQAFGNNPAFRLVIIGTPEQLKSAEATVSRLQELIVQISEGDSKLYELLKSLGTEHADVLKLNAELVALDAEIVKLEAGLKHYAPPKRIEEFKTPPQSAPAETEPAPNATSDFQLGVVLHRTKPTEAARILKLVINNDRLTAEPEGDNIVRVKYRSATKAEVEMMASVLEQLEKPGTSTQSSDTAPDSAPVAQPQSVPPASNVAEADESGSVTSKVITIERTSVSYLADLLRLLNPNPSFHALTNEAQRRIVLIGSSEQILASATTVERVENLVQQHMLLRTKYRDSAAKLGEDHPDVIAIEKEVDVILRQFAEIEQSGPLKASSPNFPYSAYLKSPRRRATAEPAGPAAAATAAPSPPDDKEIHEKERILDHISAEKAIPILRLAINSERFIARAGSQNPKLLIASGTEAQFTIASQVLKEIDQPAATPSEEAHANKVAEHLAQADSKSPDSPSPVLPGADTPTTPFAEPQSVPTEPVASSRENNQQLAEAVAKAMKHAGIKGNGIQIEVIDGVCAMTGQWRTPEDRTLAEETARNIPGIKSVQHQPLTRKSPEPAPDVTAMKVFALQHAQATEVAEVLKQVYDRGPSKIVPDTRTNSVIVTGPDAQVQEIEALLLKLDEEGQPIPAVRVVPLEAEAAKLVVQLQDEQTKLLQTLGPDHPKVRELQARIETAREAVNQQERVLPGSLGFTAMLKQYQAVIEEIEILEERLKRMERAPEAFPHSEFNVSRLALKQAEAKLADIESRIAAPNNQLKARLLRVMVSSLCQWRKTPGLDKAQVAEVEALIPVIMAQVDESPAAAQKAAWALADRLDAESLADIESAMTLARQNMAKEAQEIKARGDGAIINATEEGRQEDRLAALRRTQEARKLAADITPQDASASLEDVAAWALMVTEVIHELQKERDSIAQTYPTSPRLVDLDASITKIKSANADVLTKGAKEQAKTIAELKEVVSMMSASLPVARAKRDQLLKTDPTNPLIREMDQEIATVVVMARNYAKAIAAAESGGLPTTTSTYTTTPPSGNIPLSITISMNEISPKELQQQLTQLRKEYEAADAQAQQLAEQLKQSPDEAKKAELRKAVQRTFTARQSLLRAELMEMQTRLLQTQRSIDLRERISDQIIQRRVEDLINPQLEWEGTPAPGPVGPTTSTAKDASQPLAEAMTRLGLRLSETVQMPKEVPYRGGLRVEEVRPNGPAAKTEIKVGDILVGLGVYETVSLMNIEYIVSLPRTEPLRFYILRKGETLYGHITPDVSQVLFQSAKATTVQPAAGDAGRE